MKKIIFHGRKAAELNLQKMECHIRHLQIPSNIIWGGIQFAAAGTSGVGQPKILKKAGVEVFHDLPELEINFRTIK